MTTTEYLAQCKTNRDQEIARRPFQPRVRSYDDDSWREGLKDLPDRDSQSD